MSQKTIEEAQALINTINEEVSQKLTEIEKEFNIEFACIANIDHTNEGVTIKIKAYL